VLGLANAGGDMSNTLKQAAEFGLSGKLTIAGPVVNINNIAAVGLDVCQGLLAVTPFYWDMTPATRAFASRFAARHPQGNMPNDMQAGCCAATLAYLKAVAALGRADDGAAVAADMKKSPAEDALFGKSDIRADGRVTHPVYLMQARRPADSHAKWDVFALLDTIPPERAFRPLADGKCPLVKA
jgi:branched-chain amino acid transport system substrate-binding protein